MFLERFCDDCICPLSIEIINFSIKNIQFINLQLEQHKKLKRNE